MMIAEKLYRWSVDRLNGRFISGWCYHRLFKSRPVSITVAADNTVLGRCSAEDYRPDLFEKKLHPSGTCGFDFNFPSGFDPRDYTHLLLYVDSAAAPLVRIDCKSIEVLRPSLSRPVWFMHIPKTAGSSFNAFARKCFSADRFFTHIERLDKAERRRAARCADYLSGHLPIHQLSDLTDQVEVQLFAIIREPYSHLHSHLNYVCGVDPGSLLEHHYTYQHNETVKMLSSEINRIDFDDLNQVNSFVGGLHDHKLDFFDNMQCRYFLDYRTGKVSSDDLQRACENISRFSAVGLTEFYDRFRQQFCAAIGIEAEKQTILSNRSKKYRLFDLADSSLREALLPLVQFDLKLYKFVKDRFWG